MPQREIDWPSSDGAHQLASLLARIDRLVAQIAARHERIDDLLAQVKALNAHASPGPAYAAVSPASAYDDDGWVIYGPGGGYDPASTPPAYNPPQPSLGPIRRAARGAPPRPENAPGRRSSRSPRSTGRRASSGFRLRRSCPSGHRSERDRGREADVVNGDSRHRADNHAGTDWWPCRPMISGAVNRFVGSEIRLFRSRHL
jgi:hypothetical protein